MILKIYKIFYYITFVLTLILLSAFLWYVSFITKFIIAIYIVFLLFAHLKNIKLLREEKNLTNFINLSTKGSFAWRDNSFTSMILVLIAVIPLFVIIDFQELLLVNNFVFAKYIIGIMLLNTLTLFPILTIYSTYKNNIDVLTFFRLVKQDMYDSRLEELSELKHRRKK